MSEGRKEGQRGGEKRNTIAGCAEHDYGEEHLQDAQGEGVVEGHCR